MGELGGHRWVGELGGYRWLGELEDCRWLGELGGHRWLCELESYRWLGELEDVRLCEREWKRSGSHVRNGADRDAFNQKQFLSETMILLKLIFAKG